MIGDWSSLVAALRTVPAERGGMWVVCASFPLLERLEEEVRSVPGYQGDTGLPLFLFQGLVKNLAREAGLFSYLVSPVEEALLLRYVVDAGVKAGAIKVLPVKQPGVVRAVGAALTELLRAGVKAEDLPPGLTGVSPVQQEVYAEIRWLFQEYLGLLAAKGLTTPELQVVQVTETLGGEMGRRIAQRVQTLVLAGFHDFTPAQWRLLTRLQSLGIRLVFLGIHRSLNGGREGPAVYLLRATSPEEEAVAVAERAAFLWKEEGVRAGEMALVLRRPADQAPFVEAFQERGVPVHYQTRVSLVEIPLVQNLLGFLQEVVTPLAWEGRQRRSDYLRGAPCLEEVRAELPPEADFSRYNAWFWAFLAKLNLPLYQKGGGEEGLLFRDLRALATLRRELETITNLAVLLGEKRGTARRWLELVRTVSEEAVLREEVGAEGVRILGVNEARGLIFPVVFLSRLQEGIFPYDFEPDWIFAVPVREALRRQGIPLATPVQQREREEAAFWLAAGMASRRLYLSWAERDQKGRDVLPSRFLLLVEGGTQEERGGKGGGWLPATPSQEEVGLQGVDTGSEDLEVWTPTQLEDYLVCPFRYYCRWILQLPELSRTPEALSSQEEGQLVHRVLEAFLRRYLFKTLDSCLYPYLREELLAILREKVAQAYPGQSPVQARWVHRLSPRLTAWLGFELEKVRGTGDVVTVALEQKLGLTLPLSLGPVRIEGRVDRLDLVSGHFLVAYDYKVGTAPTSREIREGKGLALVLYLMSLAQGGPELWSELTHQTQDETRAWEIAGGGYYLLTIPAEKINRNQGLWRKEARAELGLNARVGGLVTEKEWKQVMDQGQELVDQILQGIKAGFFPVGKECPMFCGYHEVCRRDERVVRGA